MKLRMMIGAIAAPFLMATVLVAAPAGAVTVLSPGGTYSVGGPGDETEFTGDIDAAGGAGMWMVTFDSIPYEPTGSAMATIGSITAGAFEGLMMSWESMVSGVLDSTPIMPVVTNLGTSFTAPNDQIQKLIVSWTDSQAGAGFDVEVTVSAIPLPASVLMLVAALGGLGVVSRRRRTATA